MMIRRTVAVASIAVLCCLPYASAADGVLEITVTDVDRKPLPCRVHVIDAAGKGRHPDGLPHFRDHFVCPGEASLGLEPGDYTIEIERGPEYERFLRRTTILAGNTTRNEARLGRIADLAADGWYSGELHVHRPIKDVPLLMQAEDLHVAPVITWWNQKNLWADRALPQKTLISFDGNRYYDVMAGEDEREGGALLFFHLPEPLPITKATREYPSPMEFVAAARKHERAWIDVEKPFWWDVPVWLALARVDSIGIANNHMCRSTMYENEAWGKPRDAKRLPSPLGNGYWSQEIYYHVLNAGLRIAPSAGSASGVLPNPVGYNRVYVQTGSEFNEPAWWDGLKAGRSFVTNGPLLVITADGYAPGHVFRDDAGSTVEIRLSGALTTFDDVEEIEIIRNGEIVRTVPAAELHATGSLGTIEFTSSGWFLVRAIAKNPRTFRFASTAPFYVEIGAEKSRVSKRSAKFFLDWIDERGARVGEKLGDPEQLKEVLAYHEQARAFWAEKVKGANAP